MPIDYAPDHRAGIARITGTGRCTLADWRDLLRRQQADLRAGLHELNDFRGIEVALSAADTQKLGALSAEVYAGVQNVRIAVVVDPGLSYGLARMFAAYTEDSIEFELFTDIAAAEAWIREAAEAATQGAAPPEDAAAPVPGARGQGAGGG